MAILSKSRYVGQDSLEKANSSFVSWKHLCLNSTHAIQIKTVYPLCKKSKLNEHAVWPMQRLYFPLGQIILFNYSITCFPKIKTLLLVFLQIPLQQWRNLIFTKWEIFSSVFIYHLFSPSFDSFLSPPVFVLHRIIKCPFLAGFSWKEKYFQPSSFFSFPLSFDSFLISVCPT